MSSSQKPTILFLIIATLLAVAASGCNTTKGFGKDVEKVGDKIQEKASR